MKIRHLLRILGPGLLYAGAAIGVSHLVQSTRAGASYGFSLVWVLILVNALKYPFFEFGTRYAAITGESLVEGYRKMGKWAIIAFAILTLLTMFAIQAAVTIVTAGLTGNIFHITMNPGWISAILLFTTVVILMIGRYNLLDKLIKFVIVILAISTIFAVAGALSKGFHSGTSLSGGFSWQNTSDIFFLIAFIGWMPAPIDVSVWSSLWSVAKQRNLHYKPSLRDSLLDFRIGYIGTAIMACCFLSLGALVLHGSGIELSSNGTVFAGQLIKMYTESIGKWAYYIIAAAALTTMYSTTLTCIDAYPRVLMPTTEILFPQLTSRVGNKNYFYWIWILVLAFGTIITLLFFATSMRFMVDLATTLSFLTAPILAYMNYRVVTGKKMPPHGRPPNSLKIYAWIGIIFLTGFTLFYAYTYFASL